MVMLQPIRSAKFFRADGGNRPVREFLCGLAPDDRKIIGTDIRKVQLGRPPGVLLARKMGKDLWEIRGHIEGRFSRDCLLWPAVGWRCSRLTFSDP
jgi:hypothetical protein